MIIQTLIVGYMLIDLIRLMRLDDAQSKHSEVNTHEPTVIPEYAEKPVIQAENSYKEVAAKEVQNGDSVTYEWDVNY